MKKLSNVFGRLSNVSSRGDDNANGNGSTTLDVVPHLDKGHRSAGDIDDNGIGRVKSASFVEDLQSQIDSLQNQLAAARQDMQRVTAENKSTTSTINNLKDQLERVEGGSESARISRASLTLSNRIFLFVKFLLLFGPSNV